MAGVLPFRAARGELSLGYREAHALGDGLLVRRGETYRGHEFHRWQLSPLTAAPIAPGRLEAPRADAAAARHPWRLEGWGTPARPEGWSSPTLHASWLHLHWAGSPQLVRRLAAAARSGSALLGEGRPALQG